MSLHASRSFRLSCRIDTLSEPEQWRYEIVRAANAGASEIKFSNKSCTGQTSTLVGRLTAACYLLQLFPAHAVGVGLAHTSNGLKVE